MVRKSFMEVNLKNLVSGEDYSVNPYVEGIYLSKSYDIFNRLWSNWRKSFKCEYNITKGGSFFIEGKTPKDVFLDRFPLDKVLGLAHKNM